LITFKEALTTFSGVLTSVGCFLKVVRIVQLAKKAFKKISVKMESWP